MKSEPLLLTLPVHLFTAQSAHEPSAAKLLLESGAILSDALDTLTLGASTSSFCAAHAKKWRASVKVWVTIDSEGNVELAQPNATEAKP